MKLGQVQLPACQVGAQRNPFVPENGGGQKYYFRDLLLPGETVRVSLTGHQDAALVEGQLIRPTCVVESGTKGLKLRLDTFEVVKPSAPARNGAAPVAEGARA